MPRHSALEIRKIISMGLALGSLSRFITRSYMYNALLQTRCSWLDLSVEAITEVQFWIECEHTLLGIAGCYYQLQTRILVHVHVIHE